MDVRSDVYYKLNITAKYFLKGDKPVKKIALIVVLALTLVLSMRQVHAADTVPHLMNYQGRLTDNDGTALTGIKEITFKVYSASAGGTLVWGPHTQALFLDSNGYFNVVLGDDVADPVRNIVEAFGTEDAYLEITKGSKDDTPISPRQQVLSAPYALVAEKVGDLSADAGTGNIGIGTLNPTEKLEVEGTVKATHFKGDGTDITGVSSIWSTSGANSTNTYYLESYELVCLL